MLRPASTAALLCIASLTAAEAQSLSGKALTETVAGSLVEIDTPLGTKIPIHYSENGRISGHSKDLASYLGSAADTGRWWVDGDQLCHKWNKWFKSDPQCLRIEKRGSKVNWRAQDGTSGTATIVSRTETAATAVPTTRGDAQPSTSSFAMASAAPRPEKLVPPMRLTPPSALPDATPPPSPEKPAPGKPAASVKRPAVVSSAAGSGLVTRSGAAASVMPAAKPAQEAVKPADAAASQRSNDPAADSERAARSPAPRRFKVTNVEAGDVLNIRHGPSAETVAVGSIPPDGRGIEMTGECQAGWCPVSHREVRGWVRRMFLSDESEARSMVQPAAFTRDYIERAGRDSPDAPRSCLTPAARELVDRIETKFGRMRLVSTCRTGATISGSGRPSKHASGNAVDFDAGSRKQEVVAWLIENHRTGGTMTYSNMDHVHVDIGPRFVSLGAPGGGGGRYARRWGRWASNG